MHWGGAEWSIMDRHLRRPALVLNVRRLAMEFMMTETPWLIQQSDHLARKHRPTRRSIRAAITTFAKR